MEQFHQQLLDPSSYPEETHAVSLIIEGVAKLREAGRFISAYLGRPSGSRAARALDVREGVAA